MQNGRNAKLLERLDVSRDEAECGAERAALEEDVDAEAGQAGNRVGQVDVAIDLEQLLLFRGQNAIEHLVRVVRREVRGALVSFQCPVHAHGRRRADGDVQV